MEASPGEVVWQDNLG